MSEENAESPASKKVKAKVNEEENAENQENPSDAKSVYEFCVKDTYDNDIPLDTYKGKVLLIVNIASRCGHTKKHYNELTELKKLYDGKGLFLFQNFVIICLVSL